MTEKITIPKNKLRRFYEKKKFSTYQIAKIYHCDPTVIQKRLKEYKIKVRQPKRKIIIPKEILKKLYQVKKLSTYKIAKIYGCANSAIYNKLRECRIKTRPLKRVYISKEKLEDLYLHQRLSLAKIAKLYNCCHSTIFDKMLKYNIELRNASEAHTKYPKKDFSENLEEKAYLIGFRLGDLNVKTKENSSSILVKTNTTKSEQVELMRKVFGHYGHFYVKSNKNVFYTGCSLNKSFSFLIPKNDEIENWMLDEDSYFAAFLAGYTDAEGSIGIYDGRARFRLGSYDKNILHQTYNKLNSLYIQTRLRLEGLKGTNNQNKDFWRLSVNHKYSLLKLFKMLTPYLKHIKRIRDMKLAEENVKIRIGKLAM